MKITLLPGDGIGVEIVDAAVEVLDAAAKKYNFTVEYDKKLIGGAAIDAFGTPLPEDTIFVITTDGLENASRRYSKSDIKRMIERQRSKYGWEFLFIGANIDAIVTAESFGIGQSRAVNYHADKKGTKVIYDAISAPLTAMRSKGRIDDNWSEEIEEDFNNRK